LDLEGEIEGVERGLIAILQYRMPHEYGKSNKKATIKIPSRKRQHHQPCMLYDVLG
jgi:hypothetical protein